jgi:hypothetical protein
VLKQCIKGEWTCLTPQVLEARCSTLLHTVKILVFGTVTVTDTRCDRFYCMRVARMAAKIFRHESCQSAQCAPEYIQALRERGHLAHIGALPMSSMKSDVAKLFNEEMQRRRIIDPTLPVVVVTKEDVEEFTGKCKDSMFCNYWRITFKNIAPLIPGPKGSREGMFNPNFACDYAHSHSNKMAGGYYVIGYPDCDLRNRACTIEYRAAPEKLHPGWRDVIKEGVQVEPGMQRNAVLDDGISRVRCNSIMFCDGDKGQNEALTEADVALHRCSNHRAENVAAKFNEPAKEVYRRVANAPSRLLFEQCRTQFAQPMEPKLTYIDKLPRAYWAVSYNPQVASGGCMHTQTTSNVAEQLWHANSQLRATGDPLSGMAEATRYV